jgi:hypothetical protein
MKSFWNDRRVSVQSVKNTLMILMYDLQSIMTTFRWKLEGFSVATATIGWWVVIVTLSLYNVSRIT